MTPRDDLEAWLARSVPTLPDEPFGSTVIERVRREATLLAPAEALARTQGLAQRARLLGRATRIGAAFGAAVALAAFTAWGGVDALALADARAVTLGWMLAGLALGWTLLASDRLSPGS